MSSEDEEEDEAEEGQSEASGKKSVKGASKKYIPPRLVPVHYGMSCACGLLGGSFVCFLCQFQSNPCGLYHIDETEAEREQKRLDRAKKRALSSSVIRELKEQYSDAPEEIRDARHPHATRQSQEDQHRSEFLQLGVLSSLAQENRHYLESGMKSLG